MEKAVDFTRLEKNIIEVIQEEQIKLGYRSELIRLYYPITSLNRFFHTDAAEKEMSELLAEFSKKTVQTLGGVEISNKGERFYQRGDYNYFMLPGLFGKEHKTRSK